jgi:hypothetical protein
MMQQFGMKSATVAAFMLGWVSSLSAGVVAYWDFGSDSNGVTDVSGNCHSLTNSGVVISNGWPSSAAPRRSSAPPANWISRETAT